MDIGDVMKADSLDLFWTLFERLPKEKGEGVHYWTFDDTEVLTDSEARAEALADFIESIAGDQVVNTGYYDPREDEHNHEVDRYTGAWYVNIQ